MKHCNGLNDRMVHKITKLATVRTAKNYSTIKIHLTSLCIRNNDPVILYILM